MEEYFFEQKFFIFMLLLGKWDLVRVYSATGLDVVIIGPTRKSILSDEQM